MSYLAEQARVVIPGDPGGLSEPVDLRGHKLVAIEIPEGWDAAALAFFSSSVAENPRSMGRPADASYQLAVVFEVAGPQYRIFDSDEQAQANGLTWVKLLSVDPDSIPDEVLQSADREIVLVCDPR